MNVLEYFAPFLELIKYSQTAGPITNQALGTIEKFLNMGFVCKSFLFFFINTSHKEKQESFLNKIL